MTLPSDRDLLADLLVLGLLDDADQVEAERLLEADPDLAGRAMAAALRFAPLDDATPRMALPPGAWERLEARLSSAAPARGPEPALASGPPPDRGPANRNRAPWRAGLGLAAALVLALGLGWTLRPGLDPEAVAVLLDPEGTPFALIEDFGNGEAAVTTLAAFDVPSDQSLQVWTKWSEEVGPVSLGVLDRFEGAAVGAEGLPQPVAGQLYEITLEAEGGSPSGRPTGPILGLGRASIPG